MRKATCFPTTIRKRKLALVLVGGVLLAAPSYGADTPVSIQHDPKVGTNTTADCVHGGTGTSENIDCTRDKANRSSNDTNAYNADNAELSGSHLVRKNSSSVDPADGMTAESMQR